MKENVLVQELENQGGKIEKPNGIGIFGKALHAKAQAAALGQEALRLKNQVSHAVTDTLEDGKREAKRVIKRGYNAAEDMVDETAYRVKHHPIQAVAIAFGAGALFGGILIGIGRKLMKASSGLS